jgi:hypothetical protein
VSGQEREQRLKDFVRVLVAGEEGLLIYGTSESKTRWSAAGDIAEIHNLMNLSKDDVHGSLPTNAQIQEWIDEARLHVKQAFMDHATIAALRALASNLKEGTTLTADKAHEIVTSTLRQSS